MKELKPRRNEKYHAESNCGILSTQMVPLGHRTRTLSRLKDWNPAVFGALVTHIVYGLLIGNKHRKLICSVNSQAPREKLPIETLIRYFSFLILLNKHSHATWIVQVVQVSHSSAIPCTSVVGDDTGSAEAVNSTRRVKILLLCTHLIF